MRIAPATLAACALAGCGDVRTGPEIVSDIRSGCEREFASDGPDAVQQCVLTAEVKKLNDIQAEKQRRAEQ